MWPLVQWWLMLEGLGLIALPLTFSLFGPGSAYGYPFAKVLALLVLTYIAWLAGFAIPMGSAVAGALGALVLAGGLAAWLQRQALLQWLRGDGMQLILRHDALWTAGFLFFAWMRSMAPDIFGAEKYMDFAFFNLLVRTSTMPPPDPWMSGESINYYYFGYLLFATLARISRLPTYISYNLCVVTVGGLAFGLTASVAYQITRRRGLAILGGFLSAVLGNLDGFLQFYEKGTLRGMDYWRSSRVVASGDTINEFPFFSIIHGDLHPHFMVLPVSLLLLAALLDERMFPSAPAKEPLHPYRALASFALVAFVLGTIVAISPWELPIGALVVTLLAGRAQPLFPLFARPRLMLAGRIVGVIVAAYVLFLPFYLNFAAPTATPGPNDVCLGSACFKVAQTSLAEFLTVFGLMLFPPALLIAVRAWPLRPRASEWRHLIAAVVGFALLFIVLADIYVLPLLVLLLAGALLVAYRGVEGPERAGYLLIATAVAALLACELVFLKDSYGDKLYRMNTVFKLYFQAWTILAVAVPWAIDRLLAWRWQWAPMPRVITAAVALMVGAAACYPLGIISDRGGNPRRTLNGNAYLEREHPGDFAAVVWLRENVPDLDVILEASGNPYSYYARFSSNTGLPTIMGWANHEGLWRAHEQEVSRRREEVLRMYNAPTLAEIQPLLDKYGVRYVLVGDIEREDYQPAGLQKFAELEVAFRSGQTVIYRR